MLHLLISADRFCTTDAVIGRICEQAERSRGNQILIVPEQYSHETERALCEAGGARISRFAEVLSFSRLAVRAFSVCGGVAEEYLDKGGRLLNMYRASSQVASELKYYGAVCKKPAFLTQLGEILEEFVNGNISPQSLRQASDRLSGQFAQKILELSLLYESYLSVCKTGRSDPVTRQLRLLELLQETDFPEGKTFWIDGFSDFTGVQLEILSVLIRRDCELYVALCTDQSSRSIFETANRTGKTLLRLAKDADCPCETIRLEEESCRAPEVQHWLEHLFSELPQPHLEKADGIFLCAADSVLQECEYAASVVRQASAKGIRARQIAIAVTDMELYAPTLRSVFSQAALPAYFSGTVPVQKTPLIGSLVSAMQAAVRFEYEDFIDYLRSDLSPLTADAADRLEKYIFTWNLHGSALTKPFTFHPGGCAEAWTDEDRQELALLEQWRQSAAEPLVRLHNAWLRAENIAQMAQACANFIESAELSQTLSERAQQFRLNGELQLAQQTEQLYQILITTLEQTAFVLGNESADSEQFVRIMQMLFGVYSVGTIPSALDAVQIGPPEAFRHKRVKILIVLGAEDGKLPQFSPTAGILSEEERQRLIGCGIALSLSDMDRFDRELGWIYGSFCSAQEQVHLSRCSQTPSFLYQRTQSVFPHNRVLSADAGSFYADAASAASAILRSGKEPEITSAVLLQILHELKNRSEYGFTPLNTQTVQRLCHAELRLSASSIERFAACRYAFFLHDDLKVRPWKQIRFDAPAFGTFVHYVLEHTVRQIAAEGGFAESDDAQVLNAADRYIRQYISEFLPDYELRGARFDYLFRRNLKEVRSVVVNVAQELRGGLFFAADEELKFKEGEALPPVRIETEKGSARLIGSIDRVDLCRINGKTYYRIIDYKTGRKEFDYAGILQGEGLQMLLYLFALKKYGKERYGSELIPAGVLYVPSRVDTENLAPGSDGEELLAAREKKARRNGLLLRNDAVLSAMEPDLTKTKFLPCQYKKDTLTGSLASPAQWQRLERFVSEKVGDMVAEIYSGELTPNPIDRGPSMGSCLYCDYRQVCHKDALVQNVRYIRQIPPERFWEELERRENDG